MSSEAPHLQPVLPISGLIVTQDTIRDRERVEAMTKFVREGGYFTPEHIERFHLTESRKALVQISRFNVEGGPFDYLHDGHHRCLSIHLGGRDHLHPDEYVVREWDDFGKYAEVNKAVGWVTPLDLKTEMRVGDISVFKAEALAIEDETAMLEFIKANRHRYCKPRTVWTVADFAACLLDGGCLAP